MARDGKGRPQDFKVAIEWFHKAAERGDASAMCALAESYYFGRGVPKDDVLVVEWYRRASKAGSSKSAGRV